MVPRLYLPVRFDIYELQKGLVLSRLSPILAIIPLTSAIR